MPSSLDWPAVEMPVHPLISRVCRAGIAVASWKDAAQHITLHNVHYRRSGWRRRDRASGPFVPSHGRCRISANMSETMSEEDSYDMYLRRGPRPPRRSACRRSLNCGLAGVEPGGIGGEVAPDPVGSRGDSWSSRRVSRSPSPAWTPPWTRSPGEQVWPAGRCTGISPLGWIS